MKGLCMRTRRRTRGFTLVALVVVVILVLIVAAVLLPAFGMARASARQIEDANHVRGVHQSMVLWRQQNDDSYPLASLVDKDDATVSESGRAKDTTANIM